MKTLLTAVSLATLLTAGAAMAQTPATPPAPTPPAAPLANPTPPNPTPPAAMPPTATSSPNATVPARPATAAHVTGAMLGTQVWKQSVYDAANNRIGEIDDVVLNDKGQVTEALIGVGGFLGLGEKTVALPYASLKAMSDGGRIWYVAEQSKEQLNAAPAFDLSRFKR